MIVYKELSSLTQALGFSPRALYTLSNNISSHYHRVSVPKTNGEYRELSVPDGSMKTVQRRIAESLLAYEEISPYATAYRVCGSTVVNARPHLGSVTILKLDIKHFFDSIIYPLVKEKAFPSYKYSESNRILLTILCLYRDALPQGAPTSPVISNIIMKDFDNTIGEWCAARNIKYTRYCDDMTFSGNINRQEIVAFVKKELARLGFFLNDGKTVFAKRGQKKLVTGIVVNKKLNTSSAYRKMLRQELYYCRKFGVQSHLECTKADMDEKSYLRKLLGKVNYVLSVDKSNKEVLEYKNWLTAKIRALG